MKTTIAPTILLPLAGILFSGCASVSVTKVQTPDIQAFAAPRTIYVQPFPGADSAFRVDRQGAELKILKSRMAKQLSDDLVHQLNDSVLPAKVISSGDKVPRGDAWLVTGTFERVNQGSRAFRSIVGFGAGGTRIETSVVVYDLRDARRREILRFRTFGGSNQEPGPGIVMGAIPMNLEGPFSLLYGPTMTGLSFDIRRTAKEIAAELSDDLQKHGVLPKNPKLKVKLLNNKTNSPLPQG